MENKFIYKSVVDDNDYYSFDEKIGRDRFNSALEIYSDEEYVMSYYIINVVDNDDNVVGYTLEACWSEDYNYKHSIFEDLITSDIKILNDMLYKMCREKSLILPVSGKISIVPRMKF